MARKTHTEAQMRYDKVNRRPYGFRLHNELDSDIIAKLASVDSMQGYIKDLIRQDLARTNPGKSIISVPFSPAAMSILEEQAQANGMSVPDLVAVMVNEQLIRTCSEPEKHTDSAPELFRDPFVDPIAKAVGTWIDKATSILSDERPYIVSESVLETDKD